MDVQLLRKDFPLLSEGDGIIYFDNACMTLKPRQVIDKITEYYREYPGCGGRSIHRISSRVSDEFEGAREKVACFLNAPDSNSVVFTKNTTEAINLVANGFPFEKGDKVLGTDHEHNSNIVPWLLMQERKRIQYRVLPSKENNMFDLEGFKEAIKGIRLVSMVHVSNLDGTSIPLKEIVEIAHDEGATVLTDAAQSVPHMKMNMEELEVDLLAFSGHKACGPTGTGALVAKPDILREMNPFMVGGDTVEETYYDRVVFLGPPKKFEAGLQNFAGIIGLGAAIDYLTGVGLENIHEHELKLNRYSTDLLKGLVEIVGPIDPAYRGGIFPFRIHGLNSHDIALMLDELNSIAIRSGKHCVHSWFNARGQKSTARSSYYLYNTMEEVKLFSDALKDIVRDFT